MTTMAPKKIRRKKITNLEELVPKRGPSISIGIELEKIEGRFATRSIRIENLTHKQATAGRWLFDAWHGKVELEDGHIISSSRDVIRRLLELVANAGGYTGP